MSPAARQLVLVGLLLATVIGLFVAAESGQRQLEAASLRVAQAAQRQNALAEVLQILRQAESAQRGYILLGDPTYLTPYHEGLAKLPADLNNLGAAFGTTDFKTRANVAEIGRLSRSKFT